MHGQTESEKYVCTVRVRQVNIPNDSYRLILGQLENLCTHTCCRRHRRAAGHDRSKKKICVFQIIKQTKLQYIVQLQSQTPFCKRRLRLYFPKKKKNRCSLQTNCIRIISPDDAPNTRLIFDKSHFSCPKPFFWGACIVIVTVLCRYKWPVTNKIVKINTRS